MFKYGMTPNGIIFILSLMDKNINNKLIFYGLYNKAVTWDSRTFYS